MKSRHYIHPLTALDLNLHFSIKNTDNSSALIDANGPQFINDNGPILNSDMCPLFHHHICSFSVISV
jgi:hypothetical protein